MFIIAIHFYRLSCECEPRVYESLVDVLSTQCVKSFNRALHSALHGQYWQPKFRAKQACLNLQHKISSHHGTLQRYTTLSDSFTDFSFHFYATLNFLSTMVRLTDVQRGRAIALLMQGQRQQQVDNHFGVNVSTIERLVRRLRETGHLADRPRSGRPRVTSRRHDRTIRLAICGIVISLLPKLPLIQ